jgi:hypothetical protein
MDRQSAYELLKQRAETVQAAETQRVKEQEAEKFQRQAQRRQSPVGRQRQTAGEAMFKSAARSIGSTIGRQIIRGVLGSIFGKR